MRVVVAGGSGLIGRHLIPALAADGHDVILLSRRAERRVAGAKTVAWTPGVPGPWREALRGAHIVVNLCGESVGSGRWTSRRKQVLRQSRIVPTRSLVDAVEILPTDERPGVFLSASGTDVYEGRDRIPATEDSTPADTFLARLCLDWEAQAMRAAGSGARVVCLRFSPVLAPGAPSLQRMALPFRLMVGGRLGSGDQWVSWVAIEDVVGLVRWAIAEERVTGPMNVAAPAPLRQRDLAVHIGQALRRPTLLRTPAWIVRLALGEQSILPLGSRRVWPAKAIDLGYVFRCLEIDQALRAAL